MSTLAPEAKIELCKALGLEPKQVQAIDIYISATEPALIDVTLVPDEKQMQAVVTFAQSGEWCQVAKYLQHPE